MLYKPSCVRYNKENIEQGSFNMLKRFLAYYKPHKKLLFWDLAASLLISLIGISNLLFHHKCILKYFYSIQ